jgi:hypothetical protein
MPPAFGFNLKRNGASRPVTTGKFSIHDAYDKGRTDILVRQEP